MAKPKKKHAGGRPTKLNDALVDKLETAFSYGCTIAEACIHADIDKVTYFKYVKDNPKLLNRFKLLREKPVLLARTTLVKNLDQVEHAKWYLKNKRSKEFAERHIETPDDSIIRKSLSKRAQELAKPFADENRKHTQHQTEESELSEME